MRSLTCIILAGLATCSMAQARPIRIKVLHADPWFLKALFEGGRSASPEVSQMMLFGGPVMLAAAQTTALFQGGHWLVNPTDNSLLWIPDRS